MNNNLSIKLLILLKCVLRVPYETNIIMCYLLLKKGLHELYDNIKNYLVRLPNIFTNIVRIICNSTSESKYTRLQVNKYL